MTRTVCVAAALIVSAGCSADYNGERLFWKAQQLSMPLAKSPSKATPEQNSRRQERRTKA